MPQYRVRPGFRHGVGKKYGPGDILTLTEAEAVGFLDKLELVAEKAKVAPVEVVDVEQEEKTSEPTLHFWEENASAPAIFPQHLPVTTVPANAVDFASVKGISEKMQDTLHAAGIFTWEDVLQAGVIKLNQEVGIDMIHARMLLKNAQLEAD